ncbi:MULTISPECIES: glycosyltransferase [unclassified Algoriphagus]|uniref:glycosyltransferase n=2 Tax=Algoriphagus TaxID=246875 RepID=UPI0021062A9B|nr:MULTISPECIES: glycosyltransferase [unclassified Algoriphagus]
MNILFLTSSADLYGSSRIFLEAIKALQKSGINPVVVIPHQGPLEIYLSELGIPVYIFNLGILRRKYVSPLGLINRANKNLKAYRFLSSLHEKFQFELVYSNTLAVIIGSIFSRRKNIPHTWHIHEIIPGPKPLVKLLSSLLDKGTPQPIAVSEAVAAHWQKLLRKSKVQVIHNGIPYQAFLENVDQAKKRIGVAEKKVCIGMVGRINPGKGQLFFLEMAKQLSQQYPETHFLLVGDPYPGYEPILEEIHEEIRSNHLESKVSYLGFRKDIPELMAAMDIFVLPSILPDSFPTVILEAMAAGKPVVATLSGGASEMLEDGKSGFLIPIGDVKKGVEAISQLIESEDLRLEMGKAGRVRVLEEFSLESFEEKIKKHIWQHLNRN